MSTTPRLLFQFDEVCKSGALATLPLIRIELLRETSAEGGEETAFAVADAALVWLRDRQAVDADVSISVYYIFIIPFLQYWMKMSIYA